MLCAHHVSLVKQGTQILSDVSLDVAPGTLTAILGANGAGKSSLLSILAKEQRATRGYTSLDGIHLDEWPASKLALKRAILPQSSNLSFPFTALEVVLMGRAPHRGLTKDIDDNTIALHALERMGMAHLKDRSYLKLSGGERQRVHMARVLAQLLPLRSDQASYLLLDEPTASLDLAHAHALLHIARTLCTQNVGVVVVLHDTNLAACYADSILLLKHGRTITQGTPGDVLTTEMMQHTFALDTIIMEHPELDRPLVVPRIHNL